MRIGIFSGTFDPVHDGHIAFGREAMKAARLDKVVFLPEAEPWRKTGVSDLKHRTDMLKLATKEHAFFDVLHKPTSRFTVADTLPWLQKKFQGDALTLLFGSDVARHVHRWADWKWLLHNAELAIGLRHGDSETELRQYLGQLGAQTTFVSAPHARVASTQVRSGVSRAVHPDVEAYIRSNSLYQPESSL